MTGLDPMRCGERELAYFGVHLSGQELERYREAHARDLKRMSELNYTEQASDFWTKHAGITPQESGFEPHPLGECPKCRCFLIVMDGAKCPNCGAVLCGDNGVYCSDCGEEF